MSSVRRSSLIQKRRSPLIQSGPSPQPKQLAECAPVACPAATEEAVAGVLPSHDHAVMCGPAMYRRRSPL